MKIKVEGMSCAHCAQAVTKALSALPGVSNVRVDLKQGTVALDAPDALAESAIREAVEDAGYDYKGIAS